MSEEDNQEFCLKWNNYQSSLAATFKVILCLFVESCISSQDFLTADSFVDVTLCCSPPSGGSLNAHRVVLAACSPFFSSVLSGLGSWQQPVLVLKDTSYQQMAAILEFCYHGEVSVDSHRLQGFLEVARSLQIKE